MRNLVKTGLLLLALLMVLPSAEAKRIKGSGKLIKETRNLSSFHALEVGGAFEVELIKSTETKIIIKTDDNIMPYISTRVSGGELEIETTQDIDNATALSLIIYYQNLDELDISGAAELFSKDILTTNHLELDFSGAADITLKIEVESLEADFSGATDIEFDGKVKNAEIEISGAATLRAYGLEVNDLDLEVSGAANAKVLAIDHMKVDCSGASSVRYKGNPSLDIIDVSGASSFRKG